MHSFLWFVIPVAASLLILKVHLDDPLLSFTLSYYPIPQCNFSCSDLVANMGQHLSHQMLELIDSQTNCPECTASGGIPPNRGAKLSRLILDSIVEQLYVQLGMSNNHSIN
jgi:hypothetical protein